MNPLVSLQAITKRFPAVTANDHIDFDCYPGEIHALLGENGAGKTTLMNILYGLINPDEGKIIIDGNEVSISSPRDALRLGVGMIHQHFMLIPKFTVLENMILGIPPSIGPFVDNKSAFDQVCAAAEKYGLAVEPLQRVENISVSSQQKVEILRLLYRGAKILILDEPTAVLAPQEIQELFTILRGLCEEGHTIIFITHKLDEAMQVSDKISVLRDGKLISCRSVSETTPRVLAKEMIGRDLREDLFVEGKPQSQPVLQLSNVSTKNDQGIQMLNEINLTIHQGEILGIAGVDGNGQSELAQILTGLRPITAGRIELDEKNLSSTDPHDFIQHGVSHVPEDRQKDGLVMGFSLAENIILPQHDRKPFVSRGITQKTSINEYAEELLKQFDVRPPDPNLRAKTLSGGNQQKTVLAREIARKPKFLVASHPTRGLDVGSVEYIQIQLLGERERGCAILLISHDLDELLKLSDRLAVMYRGKIVGIFPNQQVDIEKIGLLMTGSILLESATVDQSTC
jgi:simple sugar transport system ATP-binding protein